jgi:hypothetical protein
MNTDKPRTGPRDQPGNRSNRKRVTSDNQSSGGTIVKGTATLRGVSPKKKGKKKKKQGMRRMDSSG